MGFRTTVNAPLTVAPGEINQQVSRHLDQDLNQRNFDFYIRQDDQVLYQGDVFNLKGSLRRRVKTEFGFLLSNTCDLVPGRELFALVVPLEPFPAPEESGERGANLDRYRNLHQTITSYSQTTFFYLPPVPVAPPLTGFEAMYGAFNRAVSVDSKELNETFLGQPKRRVLSLNTVGFHILLLKIAGHLLRPDDRFPCIGANWPD